MGFLGELGKAALQGAIAPRIVFNINRLANAAQIYKKIWQEYLIPCLNSI
ncbi:MAG: hypothetical protein IJL12_01935 [Selenomonadaceae bacterium]|nr:hypothetical protein [Selenomonadaceae bacterium]MBQ6131088.1 hypothetical protein [Selenomonadaceae bacterium]